MTTNAALAERFEVSAYDYRRPLASDGVGLSTTEPERAVRSQ
jgi:hypothetical protein